VGPSSRTKQNTINRPCAPIHQPNFGPHADIFGAQCTNSRLDDHGWWWTMQDFTS